MRYSMSPRTRSVRQRSAFTLTEILVVLGIIAILTTLGFFMFQSANRVAEDIQNRVAEATTLVGKKAKPVETAPPGNPQLIPNQYIVSLKAGNLASKEGPRIADKVNGKIRHLYDTAGFQGFSLEVAAEAVPAIQGEPSVASVEQDRYGVFTVQTVPTGIRRIGANVSSTKAGDGLMPVLLSRTSTTLTPRNVGTSTLIRGTDVVVAVIDSGIDFNHPDLYVPLNKGFSAAFPDGMDANGHGTHVAGIIGARDNDIGVVGVVPGAKLWALKVGNAAPILSDTIAAVNFATANANVVKVANLSLSFSPVSAALNSAVNSCVAAGVVVVVAAGNSKAVAGADSPASATGSIVVAALADSDGQSGGKGPATSAGPDDTFATFSNYGARVDLIAPGVDILSTAPGNTYQVLSGTSMASPYVAGLAALIRDPDAGRSSGIRNIRLPYSSPIFTPAQVKTMLLQRVRENIPGIYDTRTYPLINARDF